MRDLKDECTESDFWCGTAGEQYYQKPEGHLLSEQELHDVEYGLRSLSDEEKQWCLSEIASVEGYERCDYEDKTDSCIAYGVFRA